MGYEHTTWAWEFEVTPCEKLVLICLASHANSKTDRAFPSVRRLSRMTGLHRSSVHRSVCKLVEKKLILKESYGWRLDRTVAANLSEAPVSPCDTGVSHSDIGVSPCNSLSHPATIIVSNSEDNMKEKGQSPKPKLERQSAIGMKKQIEDRAVKEGERKKTKAGELHRNLVYIYIALMGDVHNIRHMSPTGQDYGMMDTFVKKVGQEKAEELLKLSIYEWDAFRLYLKKMVGKFYDVAKPQLAIIVAQSNYLVNFDLARKEVVVQQIALKEVGGKKAKKVVVKDDDELDFT